MFSEKTRPVKEVNLKSPFYHRGGLIFFDDNHRYCFTLDSKIALIGDFGGKRKKEDTDILETIMREYQEESGNSITRKKLLECSCLENKGNLLILVPCLGNFPKKFEIPNEEISSVFWVSEEKLKFMLINPYYCYKNQRVFYFYSIIKNTLMTD